jgi:hypothetical protein
MESLMHPVRGPRPAVRAALVAVLVAAFPCAVVASDDQKEKQAKAARKAAKEAAEAREEQAEQAAKEQRRQAHMDHEEIEDFVDRVEQYYKIHEHVEKEIGGVPRKDSDARTIAEFSRRLAEGIRARRAGARQGDIFTPTLRQAFLRLFRATLVGREGAVEKRVVLREGNPAADEDDRQRVPLKVNGTYSLSAPLSTVPPTLLEKLPQLPKEVRYQFVGRTLVLYDAEASIIVDYLPNAVS